MRTIIAVVLALALFTGLAGAECADEARVRSDVAAWKNGATVTAMGADETRAFLAAFNARPPRSAITADTMLAVSKPGGDIIVLALFEGGCVAHTLVVPRYVWDAIMTSI